MGNAFSIVSYPPESFDNSLNSYFFGKVCDCPEFDKKSILKYKADTYCVKECPFCQSQICIRYETDCVGHGEYYESLYIRCFCGLSFPIRDEKSIDVWNNAGYRKQEWISVEERLPDKNDKYWVTDGKEVFILHFCAKYNAAYDVNSFNERKFTYRDYKGDYVRTRKNITHWMPYEIPELPR